MSKFEEYMNRAKNLAEDAGDVAKNVAGDMVSKAKGLTEEGSTVRELTRAAKEQASAATLGARGKVQGVITDAKAVKEIRQGITELEALPEIEGSILYSMELVTMINDLKSLLLIVGDNRLDDGSISEEIRKIMDKTAPANDDSQNADAQTVSDEQQAIETARNITYETCSRTLEALNY